MRLVLAPAHAGSNGHNELLTKRVSSMRPSSGKFVMPSNGRLKSKSVLPCIFAS